MKHIIGKRQVLGIHLKTRNPCGQVPFLDFSEPYLQHGGVEVGRNDMTGVIHPLIH